MSQYFPKPFNSHFGYSINVKIDLSINVLFSFLISPFSFLISHLSYRVKTFDKSFKVAKMYIVNIAKVLVHTNHQL